MASYKNYDEYKNAKKNKTLSTRPFLLKNGTDVLAIVQPYIHGANYSVLKNSLRILAREENLNVISNDGIYHPDLQDNICHDIYIETLKRE